MKHGRIANSGWVIIKEMDRRLLSSLVGSFLVQFVPWLVHPDPDSFFRAELEQEQRDRPLEKPGI